MPRLRWAPIAVVAAFALLAGCSGTRDFGRVRPSLTSDDTHAWLGPAATGTVSKPPWERIQLTDEERRLRDLAYPLIEPPYDRNRWYSAVSENTGIPLDLPFPDRGAYAAKLFQTAYRSQTARYNKLIEDVRNDVLRIDSFFQVANHVADMDRRREKAMAYVTSLAQEERDNTVGRMRENEAIVRWVQASLRERAASYQIALERLVIAAPTPTAVEAERSLTLLNQKLTNYR